MIGLGLVLGRGSADVELPGDLEGFVLTTSLLPILAELGNRAPHVVGLETKFDPALGSGCPSEHRLSVSGDEDRQRILERLRERLGIGDADVPSWNVAYRSVQSTRRACRYSSIICPRFGLSSSPCSRRYSSADPPRPMPSVTRPPEKTSRVASCRLSSSGSCSGSTIVLGMIRMRLVTAATRTW